MIVAHLEAYQVAVLVWSFVFGILGLQGLISIYLEGDLVKVGNHAPARLSWGVIVFAVAALLLNLWGAWEFVQQLLNQGTPQTLALLAALQAFILVLLLGIYRRYCIDNQVIDQDRNDGVPW
jgi:hypothetical protein